MEHQSECESCGIDKLFYSIACLIFLGPTAGWAEGNDELWEMTTTTEVKGMPETTRISTVCMKKGATYKPVKTPAQKKCEIVDVEVSGDTIKWKMECSGRNPMKGSGRMERNGNMMKGGMEMASENLGMTQEISGKLIGSCQMK